MNNFENISIEMDMEEYLMALKAGKIAEDTANKISEQILQELNRPLSVELNTGLIQVQSILAITNVKEFNVGSVPLPPEFRVKGLALQKRNCQTDLIVVVTHPNIESILGRLTSCVLAICTGAAVAAIISGGAAAAAAIAALKPAVITCVGSEAQGLNIDFKTNKSCSGWHNVS